MKMRITLIKISIFIFIPFWIFNQSDNNKKIREYYQEGINAYNQKNYALYLKNFQILDSLVGNHPEIIYRLASAYALNNMNSRAIKYLNKFILVNADASIAENKDFSNIRKTSEFEILLKNIKRLNTPISNSNILFTIKEKDLHPESIAYDEADQSFYLGSIHKRKIVCIDKKGSYKDFTTQQQDGLWGVSGIKVNQKRRHLWVCCMSIPQIIEFKKEEKGRSGVFLYDLKSKKLINKFLPDDKTNPHTFGDLAIHPSEDVYVSDSSYPAIYRIQKSSNRIKLFMHLKKFRSLQGLDFSENGDRLFIADYKRGIIVIDVPTRKILSVLDSPSEISLSGIDGLYFFKNSLIVIQNGIKPMRVTKLVLDKTLSKITQFEIIERANPLFNEPTLGVIVKNDFYYIANSQWDHYDKDGKIFPLEKLENIVILKTKLDK